MSTTEFFVAAIIAMVLFVIVFVLLRQLTLWYFRINEIVQKMDKIIELLNDKRP